MLIPTQQLLNVLLQHAKMGFGIRGDGERLIKNFTEVADCKVVANALIMSHNEVLGHTGIDAADENAIAAGGHKKILDRFQQLDRIFRQTAIQIVEKIMMGLPEYFRLIAPIRA